MSERKRSLDDGDYEEILRKIRRLEKELLRKNRRRISSSSECADDDHSQYDEFPIDGVEDAFLDEVASPAASELPADTSSGPAARPDPVLSPDPVVWPDPAAPPAPPRVVSQPAELAETDNACADLDQVILDILGDDPSSERSFGEDLHKDIAPRWKHILLNGLDKEKRSALLKLYLPPENCPFIKAPKLNPEIKAALTEINNKKDIYSQSKQNQLTSCLAAVGKALNVALDRNTNVPQEIIKPLSDAGRLLCDYHHKESVSRRYSAMNTLTKQTKDTIKNTKIDEFLFGSDLAEQLKCSKAISKSGSEMRPPVAGPSGLRNKPAGTTTSQPPAVRRATTLNARGAPRAPAAEPRANPAPRRPPPAPRNAASARPLSRYRSRRT